MTYTPYFLIAVALISVAAVVRQGRSTPHFLQAIGGAALWGIVAAIINGVIGVGRSPDLVLIVGYAVVGVALLTCLFEPGERVGIVFFVVAIAVLAFFSPSITLDLLQWGAIVAVPLISRDHLKNEARRHEVEFIEAEPTPSPPLVRVGEMNKRTVENDRPVLETLPIGILLAQNEGVVEYVNQTAAHLLGVTDSDLVGQSIMTVLSRLPMMPRAQNSNEPPRPTRFELNGRQIEGQMYVIDSAEGHVQGTVAILDDVTATFQADRVKNDFLTRVSNELRTPLTAIKGYVEMLESDRGESLSHDQANYLQTIERNLTRMVHQINSLIYVAAVQEQSPEVQYHEADLAVIVPRIVKDLQPLAGRQQVTLSVSLGSDLRPIQADPQHIATIFEELITNAIRFTESGGVVSVRVLYEAGEYPAPSFVVSEIEDSGVGIDSAAQKTIFDQFSQPKDHPGDHDLGRGGVGLAIVRALVEVYSGRVWLESELGEGSKFTFILPVKQPTNEQFALPVD